MNLGPSACQADAVPLSRISSSRKQLIVYNILPHTSPFWIRCIFPFQTTSIVHAKHPLIPTPLPHPGDERSGNFGVKIYISMELYQCIPLCSGYLNYMICEFFLIAHSVF
uniref:Uncharacterized protein n=1 Tax=Sphaerodactylus townsendi TaxID=933632 RepID=A0ACB8FE54_9SAUR